MRLGSEAAARLRDEVHETVALAIWTPRWPVFVRMEESSRAVTVNAKAGSIMTMLASATGRTFAAFLPPAMVDVLIQRELADNRRWAPAGFARVTGEMMPGVHALSAPLFDHTGLIVACLTCLGAAVAFDAIR